MYASRNLLFFLFAVSGFSGLIYESIWTHYLKLFLGHAAYAQTLVLAIFMGGMALGAWWCGAASARWKNLLLGYALVEGLIGVAALLFHDVFDGYLHLAYDTLLPALANTEWVIALKWTSAALLILPQSILLGMTFPLMSGAVIRRFPDRPGATLSMLYFTNSLGGALGVLIGGFVLIEALGLPGTIRSAGALNVLLALVVWRLARSGAEPAFGPATAVSAQPAARRWFFLLLGVAALTGAASFIYEIVWIRMLSMVLGSSTHAFELMLSAFILGLALGGLWVRRRIDRIGNTLRFLAVVQLSMGAMAATTLFLYDQTFDVMAWLVTTLNKDATGYTLFNLSSHAIAAVIMLPTAVLAGMTLPLLTYTLIKQGQGEKSIGGVYAANTLGAIVGVFFATHVGMPLLGIKGLLLVGSTLDVGLGVLLLWYFHAPFSLRWSVAAVGGAVLVLCVTALAGKIDVLKTSSGVYRTGVIDLENNEVLFHKDGKTATIDVLRVSDRPMQRDLVISTNGKPDALVNMAIQGPAASDESTMILAGVLPLAFHPQAKSAAVIGMGSGLSTHTLLSAGQLSVVDTIEIEAAVIEGAKFFRPRVEAAYVDPASRFYIDDAKTHFSTHNKKYDVILSEPSNPWVSGVSGLFTREFYALAGRHLSDGGVFVQWLQAYEIDKELIASVLKALSREFKYYAVYAPNDADMIILASQDRPLQNPAEHIFASASMRYALGRSGIRDLGDLELRRIGDQQSLAVLFESFAIAPNSDYFPVVDLRAARSRFLGDSAAELTLFRSASLPALELLSAAEPHYARSADSFYRWYRRTQYVYSARRVADYLAYDRSEGMNTIAPPLAVSASYVKAVFIECQAGRPHGDWLNSMASVASFIIPQLASEDALAVWQRILAAPCAQALTAEQRQWLDLWVALSRRDVPAIAQYSNVLLATPVDAMPTVHFEYLMLSNMLAKVLQNDHDGARRVWGRYAPGLYTDRAPTLVARLIAAHAYGGGAVPYAR